MKLNSRQKYILYIVVIMLILLILLVHEFYNKDETYVNSNVDIYFEM